jgi:hypothetical protein
MVQPEHHKGAFKSPPSMHYSVGQIWGKLERRYGGRIANCWKREVAVGSVGVLGWFYVCKP